MQDTWLSSALLLVHTALIDRGVDADEVAREAGIDPASLHDPNARIPLEPAARFWAGAVHAVGGDHGFGLDVAMKLNPTALHAVGFAWFASASLREAFRRLVRYFRIVTSVDEVEIRVEEGRSWLIFNTEEGYTLPRSYDARMASLVRLCRAICGTSFTPAAVRLRHAENDSANRMRAFYGVDPEFGADEYAIAISDEDLDRPLPTGNSELALSAENIASEYLARHARDDIAARARRALIELLPSGNVNRATIAKKLLLSERTLQRRLADQGLSFAGLLDELRREMAEDYLRTGTHSINEIAYLLGFAEIASFTRAFRRWTGLAPSSWRDAQFGGVAA
ncbi:AraC family transcriptional regulator [Niveibacterium umoris]|uniref:AraC-like DNA-binding protein n=1 Tax=Niveibacterium umoris TaxID=1193620 RepID=A0A840BLU6_9RHOO|nr:AraC family transcriptional regulator [Niveibacterium umoris]MBB4014205.1 AraC-like DNA-binding protein [Niveibacterium umoris]